MRGWEPRFVGLLRNVLSFQRKDDIPTQLPADDRFVHKSLSSEILDEIKKGVKVLRMKNGRVKACLILERTRTANWIRMREDILEITRTQQHVDTNPLPLQIGAHPKSKGEGKDSRDKGKNKGTHTKNESSKKMKADYQRRCCYCQKTAHVKPQCKRRKTLRKAVDAHRPRAGTHGGETKMGRDQFFLARGTVPHHMKAVLKRWSRVQHSQPCRRM